MSRLNLSLRHYKARPAPPVFIARQPRPLVGQVNWAWLVLATLAGGAVLAAAGWMLLILKGVLL